MNIYINFSLHEYPENNYITVDCYTCGEEGDPLAAINNLIKTLDDLVGIEDKDVKFFKRGEFNKSKVLVDPYDFVNTEKEEYEEIQKKLDNISKSLTAEQVKDLQEVLNITKMTNTLKETELKLNIKFGDFYKDFLLKGSDEIVKDTFDFIGSNGKDSSDVLDFFFVNNNEEYSILNRTNYFKNRIPEHFIVIGHDSGGNLILMEKLTEEIYFWDHELENEDADMSNCYFLAKNFKEFFEEKLYEYVLENDEED